MSEPRRLKISELAEEAGVPVATVRHYLREGLLPEGEKTSRNMAYYPPELVERIKLIKQLQEERFMPLRVIGELLERDDGEAGAIAGLRSHIETSDRVFELALAEERAELDEDELVARSGVPAEVIRAPGRGRRDWAGARRRGRLLGVRRPHRRGDRPHFAPAASTRASASPSTMRRAFSSRSSSSPGARSRCSTDKLVGRHEPQRVVEMFEAGVGPLRDADRGDARQAAGAGDRAPAAASRGRLMTRERALVLGTRLSAAVAAVGAAGTLLADGPYLSLGDGIEGWLVVYAIGLFGLLLAAPFGLRQRLQRRESDQERLWELAIVAWGALALALGVVAALVVAFAGGGGALGALALMTLLEAGLVVISVLTLVLTTGSIVPDLH